MTAERDKLAEQLKTAHESFYLSERDKAAMTSKLLKLRTGLYDMATEFCAARWPFCRRKAVASRLKGMVQASSPYSC
jgi:hypothetical protein